MRKKLIIISTLSLVIFVSSTFAQGSSYVSSPLKQISSGIEPSDVVCNSGLTLMIKQNLESSICVKSLAAIKLQEWGWGRILKEFTGIEVKEESNINNPPAQDNSTDEKIDTNEEPKVIYDPEINPRNFVPSVTNEFFPLQIGSTLVYESQKEDGIERTEVYVTDQKRDVMGVATTVLQERNWLNDNLIEDTKDWFAQDLEGNVWYLGEDSKVTVDQKQTRSADSWEAGVDGAKPGIIMQAQPKEGNSYRQEYYLGKAEDMAQIISLDETISVSYGKFSGCLMTKEWNPLENNETEFKYYCPKIGLVLETNNDDEFVELTDILGMNEGSKPVSQDITVDEAKKIALEAVPGVVTDVEKDVMSGKTVYVIEVAANTGVETDVFVDIKTGKIVAIE